MVTINLSQVMLLYIASLFCYAFQSQVLSVLYSLSRSHSKKQNLSLVSVSCVCREGMMRELKAVYD